MFWTFWTLALPVLCSAKLRGVDVTAATAPPDYRPCGVAGPGRGGAAHQQRIVGGEDAEPCVWRWQVKVGSSTSGQFCGGTLINSSWVLTAAHCIADIRSNCEVRGLLIGAGTWGSKDTLESEDSVIRHVTKIYMHPLYESNVKHDYDFALLELEKPVPISPCIGTACLPSSSEKAGMECNITGWGTLYTSGPVPVGLQQAKVNLVSNQKCEENYTSTITASMLCASGHSPKGITDTCQGDSGGPLVCKESDRYVLRGVTSWGQGCAYESYPGIYGRVHSVLSWIEDTMADKVRKAFASDTEEEFVGVKFEGRPWQVVSGLCTMDSKNCILSPRFPESYGNNQRCKVAVNRDAAVPIRVMNFSTELNYDKLYVDCKPFSGSSGPTGVTPRFSMLWRSDGSTTTKGWRLCP